MMIRRVKTENGYVKGLPAADPRITTYKGIPFAAPPVGENRWRAPQPCADWEGDLLAYDFAPISMQVRQEVTPKNIYTYEWSVDPDIAMSEDCLYLNIWAPADPHREDFGKPLPVFVWYFGGGLQVGSTQEMEFDGERIARRGVVVVTVNYRLNSFGFLCHPEITKEAPGACCNFGFMDQQFATQWVKRNIAAFGGDPENITIGGQSAGGMSVGAQLGNPENRGLFQRAIIESGIFAKVFPGRLGLDSSLEACEKRGERFFEYLGVKTLAEARQIDAETLRRKTLEWPEGGMWSAAVDGRFLQHGGNDWYRRDDRVVCPVLMGSTNNEFFMAPQASDEETLAAFAREQYGDQAEAFLACFTHPATAESIRREGSVSAIDFAIRTVEESVRGQQPIYAYQFSAEIPGWDNPGAFHSIDLWFFFETLAKCWRPFTGKHYDLARQMCDYWVNFFRTGDPNGLDSHGHQLPLWPTLDASAPARMRFETHAQPEPWPREPLTAFLMEHRK